MPTGIPKSGKRNCSPRTNGVALVCEQCASQFRLMTSVYKRRIKVGPVRFCSWDCYVASRAPAPKEPKPVRVAQFDERAYQRAYHPMWRERNKEHVREQSRIWAANNKDKIRDQAKIRREARRNGSSTEEIRAVIAVAEGHCTYCGSEAQRLELDHVQPVTRGGIDAVDNFLPACRTCNASKSNKPVEDWLFEKHGIEGLARAVYMLENRQRLVLS